MTDEMQEVWDLYADDGGRSLDIVEESLQSLRDEPGDEVVLAALFRAMHTFKGNSRVLGLATVESRAHYAEDLIGLVRDEGVPLDTEIIDLLLETSDVLRLMMEETLASRRDAEAASTEALAARLKDKFERCRSAKAAAPAEPSRDTLPAATASAAEDAGPEDAVGAMAADDTGAGEEAEVPSAIIFEPAPRNNLMGDPVYREVFIDMTRDVLRDMRNALANAGDVPHGPFARMALEADQLRFAAEQMGLDDWIAVLQQFAGLDSLDRAEALVAELEAMLARDFAPPAKAAPAEPAATSTESSTTSDPVRRFFDAVEPLLSPLSAICGDKAAGAPFDQAELEGFVKQFSDLAAEQGFVRLQEILQRIGSETDRDRFRRLEFQLYEELSSIQSVVLIDAEGLGFSAARILQNWCADKAFDSLLDLTKLIDRLKREADVEETCVAIIELMRHVYYACHHYGMETAAHLSMSLVDLFARIRQGEMQVDPILLHIARSYVAAMEMVFDAAAMGDVPDMLAIEKLFEEAATVTFSASGVASASSIEARLGLPKSFHKVLTPESIKTAVVGLERGDHFYIIRGDLNADEDVAGHFLSWIESGTARVISNVTVFERDITLFDFLVCSPLPEAALVEALAGMNPDGRILRLEMLLLDRKQIGAGDKGDAAGEVAARGPAAQDTISSSMLESIGEIVTGQAMVHHMLSRLVDEDLTAAIEGEVRAAGNDWGRARDGVHRQLEQWRERLEQTAQVENQIVGLLDRLQEEAIAIRTRPAGLLLKPLTPFVEALVRQHDRQIRIDIVGDDVPLDYSMIEQLKSPLRALVSFLALQSIERGESRLAAGKAEQGVIRIALSKSDDHVAITIEDNGVGFDRERISQRAQQLGWAAGHDPLALMLREGFGVMTNLPGDAGGLDFSELRASLRASGGDLQVANLPRGGALMQLVVPLAMVVMDGMVIRVGDVMYVVPLGAIHRIVHSAADQILPVSAERGRLLLKLDQKNVLPICFLTKAGPDFLGSDQVRSQPQYRVTDIEDKRLFVVAGKNGRQVALSVDELIGQQLVLIRPLQGVLSGIRGASGCALLGGGEVGVVLDMSQILEQVH